MANIILDPRKLKAFEWLSCICSDLGKDENFQAYVWEGILESDDLFNELLYFIDNHTILDKVCVQGYSMTDIYVYSLENNNLFFDTGKNTLNCNKDEMVLNTFKVMIDLMRDPERTITKLEEGRGMDKM